MKKVLVAIVAGLAVFLIWPGQVAGSSGINICPGKPEDSDCLQGGPSTQQFAQFPRLISKFMEGYKPVINNGHLGYASSGTDAEAISTETLNLKGSVPAALISSSSLYFLLPTIRRVIGRFL